MRSGEMSRTQCLIPETGLPPVVLSVKPNEGRSHKIDQDLVLNILFNPALCVTLVFVYF